MTDEAQQAPSDIEEGDVLWTPDEQRQQASRLRAYMDWLTDEAGLAFSDYWDLWTWSVNEVGDFWCTLWDYFEVGLPSPAGAPQTTAPQTTAPQTTAPQTTASPVTALADAKMPGARWFPGVSVNYTEYALRRRGAGLAVLALDESGGRRELSRDELVDRVARVRVGLERLGVGRGDRVAAFLPNGVEALVGFLATASLGAVWSSCSPEFGAGSVLDRFRQIEPKVLLAVDGYVYGGKTFDRSGELEKIVAGLPSLEATVLLSVVGRGRVGTGQSLSFDELAREFRPLAFERVPFDHPLWVLYSSGTTGLPKAIVQGHGGILLEHLKALSLHCDLGPGDRFFWYSTTGWMMWNFLVSGLLVGSTVVLYDGSPAFPDLNALWRMTEREKITYFGTSAPFLLACQKAGVEPRQQGLEALRSVGSTGAPLPVSGFSWVYEHVRSDVLLGSISGGTDVCTAFALSCPLLPVRAGALQCAGLGCKVEAFDPEGHSLRGEVGELVLTAPLPSMPLFFWNDPEGVRYRESYFDTFPGVWRHGDWVRIDEEGWLVISGRSDSTLNRGGVRMGTSEFYAVVERLEAVADSLVVDTSSPTEPEGKLWLFVVPRAGVWDAERERTLRATIRSEISPRHVPDEIVAVRAIPRTLSGKKCEIPVKRILSGVPAEKAVSRDTLTDPRSVDEYIALRARLATEPPA